MSLPASSRGRARALRGSTGALIVVLILASAGPAWAIRHQRTVFMSQPIDWEPPLEGDEKLPVLTFQTVWTWSGFKAPLAGDPTVCAGAIVVASRDGDVASIDPVKGEANWRIHIDESLGVGPATDGTLVFLAFPHGRVLAVQGKDGAIAWTAELLSGPVVTPRVIGARLLVATTDGALHSIDPVDGRTAATYLLPGRASTPPEAAPGTILIGTDHGSLLALDETTLAPRFRYDTGTVITSPPVYDGSRVWFTVADRTVRCLRFKSGRERWVARIGATSTARPMVQGPYLYVPSYDNDLYVFNKRDGHQLTRVRLDHRLDTSGVVAQDHLLIVPFTEASVIGLTLPGLRKAGRFDLQAPGEWFTTSPLWVSDRLALGYGRNEGKIVALQMSEQTAPEPKKDQPPPSDRPPAPGLVPAPGETPPGP